MLMGHTIKVIFSRTNTQGLVLVFGLMVDNILVSGTIVLCMATVITVTRMVQHMKVSGKTTTSKVTGFNQCLTVGNMLERGIKESSMAMESKLNRMGKSEMDFLKLERT